MTTRTSDIIYGLEHQDKIFYIGKLTKNKTITKSNACSQYYNPEIRSACKVAGVKMISLKTVEGNWYSEKLVEVVNKYKDNHPLLNQQWMLEGKRGYWQDRKRDVHTLSRLSESKYKSVCQFDSNGYLVKTWSSGKEIALTCIGDYKVVNGSSESIIYNIIGGGRIKTHFYLDSYWFKSEDLIKAFSVVPKKLNIQAILAEEKRQAKLNRIENAHLYKTRTSHLVYSVIDLRNPLEPITYPTIGECAWKCKASIKTIMRLCHDGICFKYSGKSLQPLNISYPEYDVEMNYASTKELYYPDPEKEKVKTYVHTRTTTSVKLYIGDILTSTWTDIDSCCDELGISNGSARYILSGKALRPKYDLRYGQKIQKTL